MASNLWVAVSETDANSIATSIDGVTWTGRGNNVLNRGLGVAKGKDGSGNTLYVAVGSAGQTINSNMATSWDGITWTVRTNSFLFSIHGVAYANNLWVAVGYAGSNYVGNGTVIATSTDGIIWTGRGGAGIFSSTGYGYGVAYGKDGSGNGLWVVVGNNSGNSYTTTIASSPDGINWTARNNYFNGGAGYAVAYANGLWVAVGSGTNKIITSTDGITWTGRTSGFSYATSVAYGKDGSGNNLWVVVGQSGIATSSNGITWTHNNVGNILNYTTYSVAYVNNLWVVVGQGTNHSIATSPDGFNWTGRGKSVFTSYGRGISALSGTPVISNFSVPTKTIGDANFTLVPPTSNSSGDFTYTSSNTSVATIVKNVITIVGMGSTTITAVQESTISYTSATITASFQVVQSTAGVETVLTDFSVPAKTFGDVSFAVAPPTTNSDGLITYASSNIRVAAVDGNMVTIVGAGTATITATQSMSSTYASATITAPFVVNQITTVLSNFSVPTKTFGDVSFGIVAPTTTGIVAPTINGNGTFSYASSDTTVVTISGDRITVVGGGSSTITATQASTTNYTSATITAPITVNQATTVLANFSIGPKTITDASFTIPSITTNSTGLFSYTSSDPTVATIAGNVATIVGIGSATITADQASNANYLAQTISTTFSVSRNLWVAVGYGTVNTVASSYDGIVWKGLGLGGAPQSIAYSNNLWVAVGSGANTVAYSTTNGNKWTGLGKTVFSTAGYRILYDPSAALWIATGDGGNSIATSTNPKTSWIGQGSIFPSYVPVNCLYGPAIYSETQNFSAYLLGGYSTGSLLAYSLNGTTWQMGTETSTSLACQGFNTIAYGNGVYVAGCTPTGSGNSFATSTDQISWTGRGGSTKMSNVNQIAYGNGIFIAAGTRGTAGSSIMKSTDGVTWTNLTDIGSRCVAYYQGRWFVWDLIYFYYSDDSGTTWNYSSSSSYLYSNLAKSFGFGNGVVVSVGQGTVNTLAISTDLGSSWSGKGLLLTGSGNDVKYNNGVWLAVGGDNVSTENVIVKSTNNGTTWTQVAIYNTSYFTSVNGVQNVNNTWYITGRGASYLAYSNTNNPSSMSDFVMVSTSSVYFSTNGVCLSTFNYQKPRYIVGGKGMKGSVDGFSWFDILNQPFTTVNDVYWNGTIWVGVGVCLMPVPYGSSSSVRNTIAYSYDGINWIGLGATIFTTSGNNVYYSTANSLWIATGSGTNTMATSVDGITWTGKGTTVFSTAGGRITYDNNLLVAVGEGFNNFATSTDGISWDVPTQLNSGYHVTYINNSWFIAGSSNSGQNIIAKSTDGIIWKDLNLTISGGLSSCYCLAYGNGKWVACSNNKIAYSTDGTNWTSTTSTGGIIAYVNKVAYGKDGSGNGLWIAAGQGYTSPTSYSIATSTDGITWTSRNTNSIFPFNGNGSYGANSVAYGKDGSGNNLWVAVGQNSVTGNCIATSVDGTTWTTRSSAGFSYGADVIYANNVWVAVGGGTSYNIASSTDGITWTGKGSTGGGSYYMNDLAYGNGLWIACNSSGNNATSTDGITWTLRSNILPNTNYSVSSIAYANGLWVMTGYNSGVAMIATSTNSINWTQRNDQVFGKGYEVVGPTSQVTKITTVLNDFSVPAKTVGDVSFSLVAPTSNSDGVITYTSSNIAVATVVDNIVTIVGGGTTTIRATQASTADYTIGVISATLTVTQITTVLTDFSVPTKTFGDASFGIIAPTTSRDGVFTYSSSNSAVAMIGNGLFYVAVGSGTNTIASSPDGINWTGRGNTVFNVAGYNVAYGLDGSGAGLWVAVGECNQYGGGHNIATSSNGTTWTGRGSTVFTTSGSGVVYGKDASGNGLWVAVGKGGNSIASSTDGISWTGRTGTTIFSGSGTNVAYANKLWVALGSSSQLQGGNTIATSTDGINWTGRGASAITRSGYSVAYGKDVAGNGLWVVVGSINSFYTDSTLATSTDGITWTGRGSNIFSSGIAGSSVAYGKDGSGNGLWIAVGENQPDFSSSVDGINWTSRISSNGVFSYQSSGGAYSYPKSIYYANGLWVATGGGQYGGGQYISNSIATSPNGINWTGRGNSGLYIGSAVTQGVVPITTSNVITVVGAGSATITAVELATPDYAAATITAPFVVNQATPVMTNFSVPTKTFGDASFNIIPPGTNADGLITYTSSDTAVATIAGTKIIIVGGGSATISANQAGTINFVPNSITATLQVNQAIPKITNFVVPSKVTESVPFTLVAPTTNSSGAFTYTSSDISVATIDGSMVTIVGKGTSTITAVQASTTNYLSGSITATLIVRLTPIITDFSVAAKTFGDASFSIIPPITDSDGTLTYTSSNIAVATVGGGLLYVAMGSGGNTISTSTDGITWIGRGANVFTAGQGVAYANGLWVATGQGTNTIATSTDGIAWTGRGSSVITTNGNGVTFANGLWVAVGQGTNTIATSTDGITWTGRGSTVFTNNTMGIAYGKDSLGNNLLVAIGNGGNTIASSTDGITWTGRGATVFTTTGSGIAYGKDAAGNGLWVAVGQGTNTIATSSNGTTWTSRDSMFSTRGSGVAFGKDGLGNNLWVAVGAGVNSIATSSDGISWTGRGQTIFTTTGSKVTYADGLWVATGQGTNSIATSTDGITWTGRGQTVLTTYGYGVTKGGIPLALDTVTIVGAGTATITATQSLTANYVSGTITAPLVVNQATTVLSNFSVPTKIFGDGAFGIIAPTTNSNGVFTYTSSDTSVATIAGSTITIVGGGTATITANQASNTNFLSSSITATFQVNPATPIIPKFDIPVKTLETAPFTIAPPTTNSNGIFSYTSSNAAVATIDGSMVTINGLGTTTITAVQSSTANFISATTSGILAVMDKVPLSIAVGSSNYGNTIATSTDLGLTWTGQGATTFATAGYGVAGPATYDVSTVSISLYTIIDSSGIISTSEDGNTWTARSSTGFTPGKCVAYANNVWLAGGNGGLSYSLDGVNWTKTNLTLPVSGLSYANNTWIAVGGGGFSTSGDGITWSNASSMNSSTSEINDVVYGNNRWVAVGGTPYSLGMPITIFLSTNGSSWGNYGLGAFKVGRAVAYGNGQWVAVGSGFNTMVIANNTTIQTGNWVDFGSYPFTISGWGVAFGKDGSGAGFWVAVGEGTNTIATSPDGMQWTGRGQTIFTTRGTKVRYYNNLWFAFGEGGNTFATSTNGINWVGSNKIRGSDIFYFSSTYTKPTYIAVGQGPTTMVGSTNGMTWTPSYNKPFITAGYSVAWNGVQWVATGHGINTIATSTDGIIWTGNSVFSTQGSYVAYGKDSSGNGLWVATGYGGNSFATSSDGVVWTGRTGLTVFTSGGCGIAVGKDGSGNALWVATGQGGNTIATSTNGTTWVGRGATVFTTRGYRVTYANNLWIAVGSGGNSIATSTNGTTWTGFGTTVFTTQGNGIRYTNNLWVASGQGGGNTIATSVDGTQWVGRGSTVFTTAGQDVLGLTTAEPTLIFTIPLRNIGDAPFTIVPPTSNSTGLITYTSSNTEVATIVGSTVTIVGMGTSTITAVQENTDYFISGTTTATLTVENVKPVVTDFSVPEKTFGDAAFSIVAPISNSDGIFTYTSSNTAVATVAGSTITIVSVGTSTITASQAITADYGSAKITATLTVNKATPTITNFSPITKTFGNAAFSLVAPTSNSTGAFTYSSSNTAVATIAGSTVTIVGGGTATITATQATTANYLAGTTTATMTVNQATPTITNFSVPAKVTENAPFTIVNPTSNSSGAFTYTSSDTSVATIEGNVVTIVGKGTSTITATQASTTNYLSGSIIATFIVRLTPVITNFSAITKTFGDASFSIVAPTTDSDGAFTYTSSNTAVATVSGTMITIVSVGTSTISASQSLTANYVSGTNTTTLTVNKATTVLSNFSEITKTFGNAAFSLVAPTSNRTGAFTYTSSNTAVATIAGSTVTIVGGGTATITATQATTTNYLAGTTTATMTVNQATPTITNFSAITKTFGNAAFSIVAPTSNSAGSFTYTSSNTAVATIAGSTVTIVGGGTATITASQATTTNYLAGTITATMTVSQATPIITIFDVPAKAIGTAPFTLVNPTSNSSGAFTYTSSNTSVATMDGSMVTVVGLGNTTITAVQASTTNYLSGSITGILTIMVNVPLSIAVGQGGNSIATSTDRGLTWTGRGTTVFTTSGSCVAFGKDGSGNNLLVAVGQGGNTIATSTNGTTWIGRGASVFTTQGICVTYANNLWVAVGQGTNSIATSPDGVVWTGRTGTSIFSNQGIGVAFNNGLWVAVGQGTNTIATSPDGITWTGRGTSIFSIQGICVAFNNGLWVAVGDGTNSIATSTNGTVWTGRGKTALSGWGRGVAYGNGLWVAVGQGTNSIATSPDGITWTGRTGTSIFSNQGIGVAFNNGLWIAVGQGTNAIATSTDGTVWTGRGTSIFSTSGFGVAVGIITLPAISSISPSSGAIVGGTSVTITGTNFTGATSVTFDGIVATSLNIVNSTTITCIAPARSAGAVGIIVTTEDGPGGEFSSFTYITPPSITGISPLTGSTEGGTNVTITGTSFIGVTSVTFDGLAATTINVVNNTTITCITPARSVGAVGIIVTTLYGTSNTFSPFTYITPPNITSISQLTGSTAGGTNVTITGTNFTGATLVTFGGLAATSLSIVNSTTITCITPARTTAGDVGIIVTTGGGPSSAFSSFTYIIPPNITGISPSSGGIAGGTSVTITGTNFTGATSVTFGVLSATSLTIVNSTTITCITPARSAGAVGIIVTTGGGPSDAFSSFTYISPPVITSILPLTGSTAGGTSVTITGTSFTGATLVTFSGLSATSLSVVNSTTITCITPTRGTGAAGIIVTSLYGKSGAFSSFTYITPPVISRISPSSGGIAGGTNVTITGKNFTGATLVTFDGIDATSLSIVNSTTITCITPAVDSARAAGIIVTTGGGPSTIFASSFTYIPPPIITGILSSSGSTAGGTNVTITGTNFTGATLVTLDGLAATTINVVNSTTITCITPAHSEGVADIIVTTGGGSSGAFSSFTYITPPVISSISSSSGSTLGGTSVIITGTNFTGATSVTFGGVAATSLIIVNNTTISCITPARTTAGDVGIIVTTGGGPSDAFSSFTYITPPNITGISPLTGSITGGTSVTITGTNFTGATSVTFDGISATSLTIVNSTTITCITPAHNAGSVGIIVTTEGGPSNAFSSFTYIIPPVITSISPSYGSTLGGTSVTITGTSFTGATSVTFDGIAATSLSIVNSTTITCITPARTTAGAVGIIVTTGGGPSTIFASSFTYITPASITDISPSSGINTGGTSVTITGTNFTGATSVTFGGVAATSLIIVNNTTITCITPDVENDGAVGIIVTTEGGPSSTFSSFTYITNPNITGISPSSGSIAGGTNVTITGINFTGATSVTFDGLAATNIDVVNSTTITCITPAHTAGAVGIIVTAEGGPSGEFSSFTYITPPNITGILSSSGSTLGGTNVTITGTNFTGATSVTFDGLAATTINVVDNTTITCITPARATAGDVGIIVTTAGGPSDEFSSFTYITPPNITGITPSSGSILGGTSVTITGTSFTEATSVTFGGLAATSLSIVNNTTITCSTPSHNAGDVDIIVTTIYGTSNTFSPFTYITPPNITSISQLTGSTTGGTSVTITGTNFTGATTVTFDGLAATTINVVNNTTITCITPARTTAGAVGVIITTEGGPSGEFSSFTYITPPVITSILPSSGSTAGGTSATITGTNFTGATSVTFGGLAATSLSVVNSTTITCITPARTTAGAVGIIVTTGGGPSGAFSSFTYITPPNITGISPSSGSILGGTSVTITGTNFTGATSVTFDGLAATTINVVNNTTITCITPAHTAGAVGIIVTTGGGPSTIFASSFTYIAPPNITGITQLIGSTTGGTSITITGTSFTGATSVTFGGIAATSLSIVDSTTITCITPARATAGAVGVIVTTGGGPSGAFSSFTYILPPNIKSMTPSSVSRVGGTSVTITGTNFIGATSVTLGGLNATSFNVVNGTSITFITPERTTGGMVSVIVTTGGGPSNTFSTFIYVPFVSAILPAFGTRTGGTSVKITGIAFTGATSVTFGGIPATNVFVFNPTTITCKTPAGIVAGDVGVIVSTRDGPSNTFSPFTYITPPNITSISPSYGGTVGGSIVIITGKSFTGVSSVLFGGLKVKSLRVIDDTTITCVTAPRPTPGDVSITVQNSIGISNVFSSYTYIITPKLTSISPIFGSTTGGNTVTIIGTDFIGATEVTVGDLSCSSFTVVDSNTLTCITPARIAPGPVGIIVTTGGGQTKKSSPFTYIVPPVITSISPPFGGTTGGNVVTITGVNFKGASSVLFGGINATLVKAVNDTTITCKTPVSLTAGPVDVIVRTGGGPSNTFSPFTYITPPVISDISPPAGSILGGNIVTITGTNLTAATSVIFGKAAATNITVVDDTTLTCRTPLNKAGAVGVIVRTGGGPSTIFSSFTFVTPAAVTGILPLSGSTNGGTFVTIKGKDFTGATSLTIGGVEATSFTVVSATAITCITPARIGAGGVGIIVTTAGGPSKQFSFFNYITPPVITSVSPSSGSTVGGTIVTITGTNFTGATSVTINGKAATPIKVVDNTTITCKTPVNLIAGPVDVIVTTGGGPSSAFSSYTYVTPAVITSISPAFGPKAGGTSVTITGTNFTGASNILFSLKSATNINVVNDTTITCVTPDSTSAVAVGVTLTTGAGLSNKFSSFTYR